MNVQLLCGDVIPTLRTLDAGSVHCVITSPPYFGLRSYIPDGHADKLKEIGLEATPAEFVARLVEVFREVRRVLRDDGTCWINLGDSFGSGEVGRHDNGRMEKDQHRWSQPMADQEPRSKRRTGQRAGGKQLLGIPWRTAFALQDDGWILRSDIIWDKRNPMPESVRDRPTKSHEHLFLFAKKSKYYYDAEAIREPAEYGRRSSFRSPRYMNGHARNNSDLDHATETIGGADPSAGRNKRDVWRIASAPYKHAHFATFPIALVEPCILAGTSERGACSVCGAPWRRTTSSNFQPTQDPSNGKAGQKGLDISNGWGASPRGVTIHETTGWQPTCTHDASVVPCTVLDPFSGAATTGKAALKHRRHYIGIDLSEKYTAMARRRLSQVQVELF